MPLFDLQGGDQQPAPPPPPVVGAALSDAAAAADEGLDDETLDAAFDVINRLARDPRLVNFIDRRYFEFIAEHRRVPLLGDETPPYRYSGWMLWFVWLANYYHPLVPDRWGYFLSCIESGGLPDEPLPRINFGTTRDGGRAATAHLRKALEQIGRRHGFGERALIVLVDWLAWGLGVEKEEPLYIEDELKLWLYRNLSLEGPILHPGDYLGDLLMEARGHSKKYTGFFLSPHVLCEFMARMLFDDDKDYRAAACVEPSCGTGRMLLAKSNYSMNLYGVDIDALCVSISKINAALWAPWLVWPLPLSCFGDSAPLLPEGVTCGDALTTFPLTRAEPGQPDDAGGAAAETAGPTAIAEPPRPSYPPPTGKRRKYRTTDTSQGLLFNLLAPGGDEA